MNTKNHSGTRAMILVLSAAALLCVGCDKQISLRFVNHTDDSIDIELEGPHGGDEDIGKIAPYGEFRYDFTLKEEQMPADFELEADEEVEFTVNEHTARTLYVDIFDDKLIGPSKKPHPRRR